MPGYSQYTPFGSGSRDEYCPKARKALRRSALRAFQDAICLDLPG